MDIVKFNEILEVKHMINFDETYRVDIKLETNAGAEIIH